MEFTLKYWSLHPLALAVFPSVAAVYLLFVKGASVWQRFSFISGLFLVFIALYSPLHWLAQHNMMSAHMLSHVILLMIAAPLLLLALPYSFFSSAFGRGISDLFSKNLWIPWMIGVGTMWFWHFPPIHDALLHAGGTGVCGPGSLSGTNSAAASFTAITYYPGLLLAGVLLSWPIVSPVKRLQGPPGVLYLFSACIGCSLLGIILTFSPNLLYEQHLASPAAVQNSFGISPASDQQIAGLIMWVPGCLLYATAAIILMLQWFKDEEKYTQRILPHERRG